MYKKVVVKQHEKGFNKVIRQARFFAKDLDLGLFDPLEDVNNMVMLDEEDIVVQEEAGEEEDVEGQGDDANV